MYVSARPPTGEHFLCRMSCMPLFHKRPSLACDLQVGSLPLQLAELCNCPQSIKDALIAAGAPAVDSPQWIQAMKGVGEARAP